jgi:hypothetical protein
MNQAQAKKMVIVDLSLWVVAGLLQPVTRMLPTGSGSPPKIFEFLIPRFWIMLAGGATYLLRAAMGKLKDESSGL